MMTTTQQYLGQPAGRARRRASWRGIAPAFLACGTTGVAVDPSTVSTLETAGNPNGTVRPAGNDSDTSMSVKHAARHLGTRST